MFAEPVECLFGTSHRVICGLIAMSKVRVTGRRSAPFVRRDLPIAVAKLARATLRVDVITPLRDRDDFGGSAATAFSAGDRVTHFFILTVLRDSSFLSFPRCFPVSGEPLLRRNLTCFWDLAFFLFATAPPGLR